MTSTEAPLAALFHNQTSTEAPQAALFDNLTSMEASRATLFHPKLANRAKNNRKRRTNNDKTLQNTFSRGRNRFFCFTPPNFILPPQYFGNVFYPRKFTPSV